MNITINASDVFISDSVSVQKLENQALNEIGQVLASYSNRPELSIDAYRFGAETCANALRYMSAESLCRTIESIRKREKKVYLATPIIPQYIWPAAAKFISQVVCTGMVDRIVANDFGVFDLALDLGTEVTMGRMFDKRLRDPRVDSRLFLNHSEPEECGIFSPEYMKLLKRLGIHSVELEMLELGLKERIPEDIHQVFFHVPYTLVTCGMICEFSGISRPNEEKFRIGTCQGQCRNIVATTHSAPLRSTIIKRSNAIYTTCPDKVLDNVLTHANDPRISYVYTPKIW